MCIHIVYNGEKQSNAKAKAHTTQLNKEEEVETKKKKKNITHHRVSVYICESFLYCGSAVYRRIRIKSSRQKREYTKSDGRQNTLLLVTDIVAVAVVVIRADGCVYYHC